MTCFSAIYSFKVFLSVSPCAKYYARWSLATISLHNERENWQIISVYGIKIIASIGWDGNELNEFMYANVLSKGEEIIMTLQKSFTGQCLIHTFKKPKMLILSNW